MEEKLEIQSLLQIFVLIELTIVRLDTHTGLQVDQQGQITGPLWKGCTHEIADSAERVHGRGITAHIVASSSVIDDGELIHDFI
jgi:hypothetical protein